MPDQQQQLYTRGQVESAAQLSAIIVAGYVSVQAAELDELDDLIDRVTQRVLVIIDGKVEEE